MIIMSFEGAQGCGKSTAATALAYEDYLKTQREVMSNSWLNIPNMKRFSVDYFVDNMLGTELENVILLLDELHQLDDCRTSSSKLNILFGRFIHQARKRGVDLYICSHYLDYLDLRTRRAVNIRGACTYHEEKPCQKCGGTGRNGIGKCGRCLGYGKVGLVMVYCLDRRPGARGRHFTIPIPANRYWHLFDTNERMAMQAAALKGIERTEVV